MIQPPSHTGKPALALITGASYGIGAALARQFASHGHNLVLVARDQKRLSQLRDSLQGEFGIAVKLIPKDLSVTTAAQEIVQEIQQVNLKIGILVNNAGFDLFGYFWETDLTKELNMIQVNLVSLTLLTKLTLPEMIAQGEGRILNLGSTGSFIASPLNAVYTATKAYVLSFSEAIGEELRGTGVTVTVLCPGATRTEFHKRADAESIRLLRFGVMEADQVAGIGYRSMMAGKRVVVPGLFNQVQVFLSRILPKRMMMRLSKVMLSTEDDGGR